MRLNIKRALYNDMLGNPDRTPASATEIAESMADLSRRIGSAFGRLQAEMVQPVLTACCIHIEEARTYKNTNNQWQTGQSSICFTTFSITSKPRYNINQ